MDAKRKNLITAIVVIGSIAVAAILVLGTIWMGRSANNDTQKAVHTVSSLFLDELAGRREQVVESNLQGTIRDLQTAVSLMDESDLQDLAHLQAYQTRMKQLYTLDKFAFVDSHGLIYTALGYQSNIDDYQFDYRTLSKPEISILNLYTPDKKVVIAVPVDIPFQGETLTVCFMEIDMKEMLAGVSMEANEDSSTFCNIYTSEGIALSNTVLGGLAVEDNLLDAMRIAQFHEGYSYEQFLSEFTNGVAGEASFTYGDIQETLAYVPVDGTDWLLTYLIRDSVISERISTISEGTISRSVLQSILTVVVLLVVFAVIIGQTRRNAQQTMARETAEAEVRGKQEELEYSLALQNKLEQQSHVLSDALAAAEQANRAKTTFLSSMSHEIRTPMNAIIGLQSIAVNDPETPEKTRGYLEKIGTSAEHLLSLINDVLDMSRIESGRMTLRKEEFSFSKLLEAINIMFSGQAADKGLEYRCQIIGNVDEYYVGDNMKLRQVLINILGNAVKFTPEGGKVSMDVERVAHYDGLTTLRFVISDTGIGMSEEFLPHIFDAFAQEDSSTTNRYGSSGLGLAITKSIVEMMNGDISVESEKGKGSTFTVHVTLADSERPADAGGDAEEDVRPSDLCVLIVDDDPVAAEHAKLVLEKAGIASETAASGQEAVDMVQLRHARQQPFNLILVDWKMPEMDGVECTRRIRAITGHESAIIILTAYRWDDVLEEALEAGVDSFIPKPLFAGTVLEEFKSALARKNVAVKREERRADLRGRRILLAEDVQVNAEIMMMVLEMREMEVDHAENGRIAVEKFASEPDWYYDAILMDIRMPEMDGLEATRTIRALSTEYATRIPIIALTANAFDEDVQRSLQAGLNAHLSKPVQPDVLYETLETLIPSA